MQQLVEMKLSKVEEQNNIQRTEDKVVSEKQKRIFFFFCDFKADQFPKP